MKTRNLALCCLSLLWFASTAFGANFQAKVIHITDGDTITVLNDSNEQIKIRLNGIDCPEQAQAYGNKAKQFTKNLVAGQMVTIHAHDQDKYGRTIGDVVLEEGRNLSQELVKAGYSWWFFKCSADKQLGILEVQARIANVGLWEDKSPIPPWVFRPRNKLATLQSQRPSSSLEPPSASSESQSVRGNRRSKKYLRIDCSSYDLISPKNRVPLPSPQDAEQAGYVLAGNCAH